MPLQIITGEDYPQVRALIDLSVRPANLPDEIIELPVYGGAAEHWALASVGDISMWPEEALLRLRVAICYRLAGLILPALPNLTQEQKGERAGYSRTPIDVEKRRDELFSAATDHLLGAIEIAGIDTVESVGDTPLFTLAKGRRRW
jgi:hypothetical protein